MRAGPGALCRSGGWQLRGIFLVDRPPTRPWIPTIFPHTSMQITMYTYIPATDEFQLMQSFNGRVYRTYLGGSFTEVGAQQGVG